MTADDAAARRYLLGDANEAECAALEETYFRNTESADRIAQAEEELIEDYLAGDLALRDREKFEHVYLVSPEHRIRVETMRRLMPPAKRRGVAAYGWFALAAAAVIAVATGLLWLVLASRTPDTVARRQSAPQVPGAPAAPKPSQGEATARNQPVVFAISLSPVNVRGAGATPVYRIPSDATIVALDLEGDRTIGAQKTARIAIATVEGRLVWTGITADGVATGAIAHAEVPAASLRSGDYIVRLFGTDAKGGERERGQYYLRIR